MKVECWGVGYKVLKSIAFNMKKKKVVKILSFCFQNSRSIVYDTNVYQCQFCPLGISSQRMLERHLLQDHRHLLERMERQAHKEAVSLESPTAKPSSSEDRIKILMRLPKTNTNARSLKVGMTKSDSKLTQGKNCNSM